MKNYLFILLILMIRTVFAENTEILKCHVTNEEWQSTLVIDSLGGGILRFQKTGDSNFYACNMRLVSFSDTRGGVVPMLRASLSLVACDPDINQYRTKILSSVNILVNLREAQPKEGSLQWLQDKMPDVCQVEKLKLDDLKEYAIKWSRGQWGRKPASMPDKIKKKF